MSIKTEDSATAMDAEELVGRETRPDGEALVYKSFRGMRSHSTLDLDKVELTLTGPIDLGRRSDVEVADRVITVLRSEGKQVEVLPHLDSAGEDRKIRVDGAQITIQVVTVPSATDFIQEASRGSATTSVPIAHAAAWINDAVRAKGGQYEPVENAKTLLALDVRAVGVIASPQVARAVEQTFGNLCGASGFGAVHLVGPDDSHCIRLPSSRW